MGKSLRIYHFAPNRISENSAAWRILKAQRAIGIDALSLTLNLDGLDNREDVAHLNNPRRIKLEYKIAKIESTIRNRLGGAKPYRDNLPWNYGLSGPNLIKSLNTGSPDILNVHWWPSSIDISALSNKIPIVFTLHDVWPLTGGCHCNLECNGWQFGCKDCPQFKSKIHFIQCPSCNFQKKMMAVKNIGRVGVIAPSNWMYQLAINSPIFREVQIAKIPNPPPIIEKDSVVFEKTIEADPIRLCFIVSGSLNQFHKGADLFFSLLKFLDKKIKNATFDVTVVGMNFETFSLNLKNIKIRFFSEINDETTLFTIIKKCDYLINTTRQENFSNTILEALTLGTKVVAFNIGGNSDLVTSGINGFLIEPFRIEEMADILITAKKVTPNERLAIKLDTLQKFDPNESAKKYKEFYENLLNKNL